MKEPLSIDRSIDIDADAPTVFELIAVPGWYINDGELREHSYDHSTDVTLTDPVHGAFRMQVVELRPHSYAAFRWLAGNPGESEPTTLVEFFITERPGGVTLRVRESGFESLSEDELEIRKNLEDNDSGWQEELAVAKRSLETGTAAVFLAAARAAGAFR